MERKPYIQAASTLMPSELVAEMSGLLESCRPFLCHQSEVLCRGWTTREKASSILAKVHQQKGDNAALLILAAFIGTASMPMSTSNPRYAKVQQGRAVYRLLKSETQTVFNKTMHYRIGMQGYRLAEALHELIDGVVWPLLKGLRLQVLEKIKMQTLE